MQSTSDNNSTDMKRLPMQEVLKPLAWLRGTWRTNGPAEGKFSTIKPFTYCELMTFSSLGQPMLNYSARSWYAETKNPLHYEVGFLRIIPNTNKVFMVMSHNFGVTTIEEGVVEDKMVKLKTTCIARPTVGMTRPMVTELQRQYELVGDCLHHILYMATENTPEPEEHLRAVYVKHREETDEDEI